MLFTFFSYKVGKWRLGEVQVTWRLSFLHCITNYSKHGGLRQHRCDLPVCRSGRSLAGCCAQALPRWAPRCWLGAGLIGSWGSSSKLLRWLAESNRSVRPSEPRGCPLHVVRNTALSFFKASGRLSLWEGLSPSFNGFHPIKSGPLRVVSLKKKNYLVFICLATSHPICGMRDLVL